MTQDEIIEMSKQSNLLGVIDLFHYTNRQTWIEEATAFAKLVAEKEREAIWNIIFEYAGRDDLTSEDESLLKHLADLIKARGQA